MSRRLTIWLGHSMICAGRIFDSQAPAGLRSSNRHARPRLYSANVGRWGVLLLRFSR